MLMLNDFKESSHCLRAAQRLDPKNEDINRELKKLEEKQIANLERERDMCQNMFSDYQSAGPKKTEEKGTKAKTLVSDKFCSMVREDLTEFKNSDGKGQFNLPSGLTAAEEEFIRTEASTLGLKVTTHGGKLSISK
ncbi:hypothetical protein J437_LFUL011406 [Ladona fulva]|uniref:Uncharacterized protein n=1 Tax=Ladona fulva TaxID=123851 RepID=A0A8K0P3P1_LADFU|nr:hypothetical protein J437_LFUL011406 [Ladona fulva]